MSSSASISLEQLDHQHWSPYTSRDYQHYVTMLLKIQLHWEGYIFRMEDHHLPKVALYGELATMTQGYHWRGTMTKKRSSPFVASTTSGQCKQPTVRSSDAQSTWPTPSQTPFMWRVSTEEKRLEQKKHDPTRPSPARKSLPVSHRPCESPACLQQMQTPTFLSLYLQQM